jgi:hypothetical protein
MESLEQVKHNMCPAWRFCVLKTVSVVQYLCPVRELVLLWVIAVVLSTQV